MAEPRERPARRGLAIAAAVAVIAAIGGGYALWTSRAPTRVEGEPPLEPLAANETRGYMANAGVASTRHSDLLAAEDAAEELAKRIRGESPAEKAGSLARYVAARRAAGAIEPWSFAVARREELRTHAEVAAALARDGGKAHLYPLEVAALAVAALRSEDVPAMLAEVWGYAGERAPLDPVGQVGYYAVAVYADEAGEGKPVVVDVYGGRDAEPPADSFRVLNDVQAVSAALVLRAHHALHVDANSGQALGVIEDALKLDGRSPSARVTRAMVLLAAQGVDDAKRELEAAVSIRADAPRRLALSSVHLVERDLERAEREVRAAIEERPGYGLAFLRLATIQMEAGETSLARESLEEAARLEADVPELPLLFAQYHMVVGEHDLARARARETVERFGDSFQAQLMAAQFFRATGDENDMRRAVQAALAAAPENRRAELREQIAQSMGESALEPPTADEPDATSTTGALELRLGEGADPAAPAAGDLGLGEGAAEGPAIMMGDPSDYRLLGPNDRLQLRLNGQ